MHTFAVYYFTITLMLEIKDITFSYGRHRPPVLNDFSANIRDGDIYGLLGRNGAGKSTLLYLAAGLLTPQSGHVYYNGTDTRFRRPSTLSDIFIVPEEFSLPNIRLREFLRLNSRFYPNFSLDDMRRHLDTFELESDLHLGSLSMGQKKKAFMCFALACNTSLLLLDEPTNGLDIPGKSRFRKFIVSSMTDDRTILISTHQVRDIDRILDMMLVMENDDAQAAEKMIYSRNDRWVAQLAEEMPEQSIMVVVGAGHLPGERGVIAGLRKAGFKVTAVR